jgi:hypothetical protein
VDLPGREGLLSSSFDVSRLGPQYSCSLASRSANRQIASPVTCTSRSFAARHVLPTKGCNVARVENTVQIPLRRRGRGGVLVASFLILPVTVIFTLFRETASRYQENPVGDMAVWVPLQVRGVTFTGSGC